MTNWTVKNKGLDEMGRAVETLKNIITSPDSFINKNYSELRSRVDKLAEIIAKQQQFLEENEKETL